MRHSARRSHQRLGLALGVGPRLWRCAVLALILLGMAPRAQAYIDPGTGSYLLQALVAGVMGAGMALKLYWHKVKAFFSGSDDTAPRDD